MILFLKEEEEEEEEEEEQEEDATDRMRNDLNEVYDNDTNKLAAVQVRAILCLSELNWIENNKWLCSKFWNFYHKNQNINKVLEKNVFNKAEHLKRKIC